MARAHLAKLATAGERALDPQRVAALLLGGWYVLQGQLEVGGVVAFISGVEKLNDPWGDLVNYFRDFSVSHVKYRLVSTAVADLVESGALAADDE